MAKKYQIYGSFSSGDSVNHVVRDTPPEDTSVLWVDTSDNNDDGSIAPGGGGGNEKPIVIEVYFRGAKEDGGMALSEFGTVTIPNEQETIDQIITALQNGNAANVVLNVSYNELDALSLLECSCIPVFWELYDSTAYICGICTFKDIGFVRVGVTLDPNDLIASWRSM